MCHHRRAFTLVEILIVVIILAIIAAIVVPRLTNVTTIARETNLKENLSKIRAHIQVYRNQHASFPDTDAVGDQLTKYTNFQGDVAAQRDANHRFGPYIEQFPPNPISGVATLRTAANPDDAFPPGDADGGWWYNPLTGRFFADLLDGHVDNDGSQYNRY